MGSGFDKAKAAHERGEQIRVRHYLFPDRRGNGEPYNVDKYIVEFAFDEVPATQQTPHAAEDITEAEFRVLSKLHGVIVLEGDEEREAE